MNPDFFVDSVHGLDTNPGTELLPFQSFARLLLEPSLGPDTIVGVVAGSLFVASVDWTKSGGPGRPLRLVRVGVGAAPQVDGGVNAYAWRFLNCAYVHLEGFDIFGGRNTVVWSGAVACELLRADVHHPQRDGGALATTGRCLVLGDASSHETRIVDSVVRDAANHGVHSTGAYSSTFSGCVFRDIGDRSLANDACGVLLENSLVNTFTTCAFVRCYGRAGLLMSASTGIAIRTWFADCYRDAIHITAGAFLGVASLTGALPDDLATDLAGEGVSGLRLSAGGVVIAAGLTLVNGWSGALAGTGASSFKVEDAGSAIVLYDSISQALTDGAAHWYLDVDAQLTSDFNLYWPDDTTPDLPSGRFITTLAAAPLAGWRLLSLLYPSFVSDPNSLTADPLLVDPAEVSVTPLAAALQEGSPARGAGTNLTGTFLGYGVQPEDFVGRLREPSGNWDIGAFAFVFQPVGFGEDLVFRTNRVGAALRFGVVGTRRLGLAFSDDYVDLRDGEIAVPPTVGFRIYPESQLWNPPPFRVVPAVGLTQFTDRLDPARRYVCDVEVARLATARRADRSVPLTTERYRETAATEERGSFGRFCAVTDLLVSSGATLTAITDPRPSLPVLFIGDDLLETALERAGYDSFDDGGVFRPSGWRDSYAVRAIERAAAQLGPPLRMTSVNLTDASFSLTGLEFPRGVGSALYSSLAAFKDGVGTRPDVDGEVFREPFWSYPGAVAEYVGRLAEDRDLTGFSPELAVVSLGRRDQEYADAYDPGWPDAVRLGLKGLVLAIRAQWPNCRVLIFSPHCPGPVGRYDPAGPQVDLVETAITRAVDELVPYTVPADDLLRVSLADVVAAAQPGFGTVGRTLSAEQHGLLADGIAAAVSGFLAGYDQGLPQASFDTAANSQYEALL